MSCLAPRALFTPSVPLRTVLALLASAALSAGCKTPGPFVWASAQTRAPAAESVYLVQPGDVLHVRVYNQDAMTTRARVRADGKISLPFVNDVAVAGVTPGDIAKDLQVRLKDFIVKPTVTVSLEEAKPLSISIVGEVNRPGLYPLESGATVLHALAMAGGFNLYASKDSVYVVRKEGGDARATRIRFRYHELVHVEGPSALFRLKAGDVMVVE